MGIAVFLQFSRYQWHVMHKHIKRCFPEEACGLIGGRDRKVDLVLPVINELHSSIRYRMDRIDQLKKHIWLEGHHLELLGIYHSHPNGPNIPSETDVTEFFYPKAVSVIWFLKDERWHVRGFRILNGNVYEVSLKWSVLA